MIHISPALPAATLAEPELIRQTGTTSADLWKVIVHNDTATPMDFVILILVRIFQRPLIIAEAIMWEAHNNGNAVVVVLPKAEAEKRVKEAWFAARLEGFPLTFTLEPA
jgi:ATP-dependent Clp protease adaptor protein ClpS